MCDWRPELKYINTKLIKVCLDTSDQKRHPILLSHSFCNCPLGPFVQLRYPLFSLLHSLYPTFLHNLLARFLLVLYSSSFHLLFLLLILFCTPCVLNLPPLFLFSSSPRPIKLQNTPPSHHCFHTIIRILSSCSSSHPLPIFSFFPLHCSSNRLLLQHSSSLTIHLISLFLSTFFNHAL